MNNKRFINHKHVQINDRRLDLGINNIMCKYNHKKHGEPITIIIYRIFLIFMIINYILILVFHLFSL